MEEINKEVIPNWRKILAIIVLILTTVLWGTTFIITKKVTQNIPIFLYLGLRYLIATVCFIPLYYHFKDIDRKIILGGMLTGFIYYLSMVFQTYGLQTTTAGKAGFVTGLSTIMVPFILWLFYKKKVKSRIWIAVLLSIFGMALLLLEGEFGVIIGDILVLGCAVFCAIFVVLNNENVRIYDVYLYSIIQLMTLALLCLGSSFIIGETYNLFSYNSDFWLIMLYMGFGTTTITFLFQNWGQQYQGPSQTAIIFTLEPVFAAFFGFLIGNEIFTIYNWIGTGLIFIAILITVLKNNE